ncbi:MAG TPA: alpha/beta fold hydrolase [Longimicrobiales bacterium]|nr:alpha/beta fold hydrolase [Longimicrobiales bacterium]
MRRRALSGRAIALSGAVLVAWPAASGTSDAGLLARASAPVEVSRASATPRLGAAAHVASFPNWTGGETPRTAVPVLLVPGWLDSARDLAALRIRLVAAGWSHVETLTFRDPAGSNRDHAAEIDSLVTRMLSETGADEIDIVAHSMGGLATRWYLMAYAPAPVRRVAFLGSPHRGTLSAHLAWGVGAEEMTPGSAFLNALDEAPAVPEGLDAITVRTPIDTHVVPGESATLPGVPDHSVCCPTHRGLLRDDEVFRIVLDFLESVRIPAPRP